MPALLNTLFGKTLFHPSLPLPNDSGEALDMVSYAQVESYTCGYVAGLMILHTFHPERSENAFRKRSKVDHHWHTTSWGLIRALQEKHLYVA